MHEHTVEEMAVKAWSEFYRHGDYVGRLKWASVPPDVKYTWLTIARHLLEIAQASQRP